MEADERHRNKGVDSDGFERSESDSDGDSDSDSDLPVLRTRALSEFATLEKKKDGENDAGTFMRMNPLVGMVPLGGGSSGGDGGGGGAGFGAKGKMAALSIGGGNTSAGASAATEKEVPRITSVSRGSSSSSSGSSGSGSGSDEADEDAEPKEDAAPSAKPTLPGPRAPASGKPAMPKLTLGGGGSGGGGAGSRKPPGLGLSLGGAGEVQSNSANPSPSSSSISGSSSGLPSPAVFRAGSKPGAHSNAGFSLSNHRPVGLNLEALRDDDEQPLSELQVRREKFAFFEKHCTKIVDGVYVAGEGVARNRATLDEHGITHVINCNAFIIPNYFEPDLVYKTLW